MNCDVVLVKGEGRPARLLVKFAPRDSALSKTYGQSGNVSPSYEGRFQFGPLRKTGETTCATDRPQPKTLFQDSGETACQEHDKPFTSRVGWENLASFMFVLLLLSKLVRYMY